MNEKSMPSPLEETVAIVGVGLIGGSLAAALRRRGIARRVIGVGRNQERMDQARSIGLIDEAATELAPVVARANLIVFCTPVDRVAEGVKAAAHPLRPGTLLTDAGSVKQSICQELADVPAFIGSHPIAGSHRQGFEAADAQLFEGRLCVITPLLSAEPAQIARLQRFWQAVGMQTVTMAPDDHDRALSMTSHLPHVVAAALAATLTPDNRPFVGTGFRDTTRIAAGDPELWSGILCQNSGHVVEGIDAMMQLLEAYRIAILSKDEARITQLLNESQMRRKAIEKSG